MIGKLKGRLEHIGEEDILLDVAGVCYVVFLSSRTLYSLPQPGEALELWIETHVREDHIHLFGFTSAAEQAWFRTLTKVQGVGAKMGLAILGSFAPAELQQAIAAKDSKILTRASGVGPKLAERLVTELKNKVANLPTGDLALPAHSGAVVSLAESHSAPAKAMATTTGKAASTPSTASLQEDATSALVNLGYGRSEAFSAVARAASQNDNAKLDDLIRLGLKELAG